MRTLLLLLLVASCASEKPIFKVGDCIVNYGVVKVAGIGANSYALRLPNGYLFSLDIDYVNDDYVKVDCKEFK